MATLRIVTPVFFHWNGKHVIRQVTLLRETLDNPEQAKNLMLDFRGEQQANDGPDNVTGIYTDTRYL